MGKCEFCGEKAGFLRWKHSECQSAHDKAPDILFKELLMVGERAVPDSIEIKNEGKGQIAISTEYNDEKLLEKLKEEVRKSFEKASQIKIEETVQKDIAMQVCFRMLDNYLEDDKLDDKELGGVMRFSWICELENHENHNLLALQLDQSRVLARLAQASDPSLEMTFAAFSQLDANFPLVLMKSEKVVHTAWVDFYEERTRTSYVGGSDGVSIRVAKGAYYRTSGFKGERIQEHEMELIDSGLFALTTKHIYFHGDRKSFRTRLDRIVAIEPFEDGIGIRKEGTTARPQIFKDQNPSFPLNSWFTTNAIRILVERLQ